VKGKSKEKDMRKHISEVILAVAALLWLCAPVSLAQDSFSKSIDRSIKLIDIETKLITELTNTAVEMRDSGCPEAREVFYKHQKKISALMTQAGKL
jgi:hypothetical protein